MKPVGILGGMGPEATLLLMRKCLDAVDAQDDAAHVPLIVHQNPQVPSRIAALIEGDGENPAPALADMARELERAGAVALAMPCNTAHHFGDTIRDATSLPFLDMIELTARHLASSGARHVGMLASPAVRLTGVYHAALEKAGLEAVFLADDAPLLALIRAVKSGNAGQDAREGIAMLAAEFRAMGCDHLLVACTELSLLAGALPEDIPHTDSLDCLVRAILDTARGDGLASALSGA